VLITIADIACGSKEPFFYAYSDFSLLERKIGIRFDRSSSLPKARTTYLADHFNAEVFIPNLVYNIKSPRMIHIAGSLCQMARMDDGQSMCFARRSTSQPGSDAP
jgi:hypothetical protein